MQAKSNFNLLSLLTVILLVIAAGFALMPATSSSVMQANMTAVGCRGRDIYVAIAIANVERETLGLPPLWPADPGLYTNAVAGDISSVNFTNSTDFFWALNDGPNLGTEEWSPYVAGFDFSKLAGAGVPAHTGAGRLMPTNNIWTIAKNIRDEMEDVIPILITRNVAAESLAAKVTASSLKNRVYFDSHWDAPFYGQRAVLIRKGGGSFFIRPKHMTWRAIYDRQIFDINTGNSSNQIVYPLRYLTPTREVTLAEDIYASGAGAIKVYWHYWFQDFVKLIGFFLVTGAVPAISLLVIVLLIKICKTKLTALSFVYWLFLLFSIVSYMCIPFAFIFDVGENSLIFLLTAVIFQVCGYYYLKSWKRRTGNIEAYSTAFKLMLAAPLIAVAMLFILSLGIMP